MKHFIFANRFKIYLFVSFVILGLPFLASLFTKEVNWNLFDYVAAEIILMVLFGAIEIILKYNKNKNRIWLIIITLILVILTWLELAVGLFNSPFAGS